MNFSAIIPQPNILTQRPVKVSAKGNVYKIPIIHTDSDGKTLNKYEVWTTKEAVQKHFDGLTETPREYQLRKFARQMYDKRLRASNGKPAEGGMFVSSNDITHGNPTLWPHTIMDPEAKI